MEIVELVSIVVPVYNVKEYLKTCIESARRQTYPNLEIILVDDGSSDGSEKIVDEFASQDERVYVLHQKNQGLSVARNVGVQSSKGEYVFLLDADDFLREDAIEIMVQTRKETGASLVVCNHTEVDEKQDQLENSSDKTVTLVSGKELLAKEDTILPIVAWGKLYPREVLISYPYPQGKLHEDEFVTYKILYSQKKVAVLSEKLYAYRQRKSGITGSGFCKKRYQDLVEALTERKTFYEEKKEYLLLANTLVYYMEIVRRYETSEEMIRRKNVEIRRECFQKALGKVSSIKKRIFLFWYFTGYKSLMWILGNKKR